ncbi:response regulator [Xanthocytophaga agilis]|uniref:Response regulator n=1 Tax=Xanthocytophaga agilis TaxID=3048010 RepID=A0AAE3R7E1_9BACT|nr:response regulator [Xanthocytophaga agilis]MDJ1502117.1 response regulator [Xanthocytophaga agilis]
MRTILIAHDKKENPSLLQMAFTESNINNPIFFFTNGLELTHHLVKSLTQRQSLPAFILLDLNMSQIDGKATIKELKSNSVVKSIPVVVFSTSSAQKDIADCYDLGANSYLIKPDSFTKLVEMITQTCTFWLDINCGQ